MVNHKTVTHALYLLARARMLEVQAGMSETWKLAIELANDDTAGAGKPLNATDEEVLGAARSLIASPNQSWVTTGTLIGRIIQLRRDAEEPGREAYQQWVARNGQWIPDGLGDKPRLEITARREFERNMKAGMSAEDAQAAAYRSVGMNPPAQRIEHAQHGDAVKRLLAGLKHPTLP